MLTKRHFQPITSCGGIWFALKAVATCICICFTLLSVKDQPLTTLILQRPEKAHLFDMVFLTEQ